jgi:hypothetical protein
MDLILFAPDPQTSFRPEALDELAALVNNGAVAGIGVRHLELLTAGNQHGVCFEPFALLGRLCAQLRRGLLSTCLVDLADLPPARVAHLAATLLRFGSGYRLGLGVGVRHNAADSSQRLAGLVSRLAELEQLLDAMALVLPFDRGRLELDLVGGRTIERVASDAPERFAACASITAPAGWIVGRMAALPTGPQRRAFAAVELVDDGTNEERLPAFWRLRPASVARELERVAAAGCTACVLHTVGFERQSNAWLAALGLPDRASHSRQPAAATRHRRLIPTPTTQRTLP